MTEEKKFRNVEKCSHSFCLDCIAKYIEAKVSENTVEVPCPALNCDKLLDPLSCHPVLPAGLFEKWCDLLCESSVLRSESAYCPSAKCSALVLNECGENITRSKCPNCKKLFCFQCKILWHAGFGCHETEQMRDENDILFGKLVERKNWMTCPCCKYRVEQNGGGRIIKCRCGVLFCYDSGKINDVCDCYRRGVGAFHLEVDFFILLFSIGAAFLGAIVAFYMLRRYGIRIPRYMMLLFLYVIFIVPITLYVFMGYCWRRR